METNERPVQALASAGYLLAPIHCPAEGCPLRICVVTRSTPEPGIGPFVLLRELPGSRVYLGAVCDAADRIQEWVEVWVQTLELRDLVFSNYQERLANHTFDQRWRSEHQMAMANLPRTVIVTGMEETNPGPILLKRNSGQTPSIRVPVEATPWRICKDDSLLQSFGLPPYSTSPFRYLFEPNSGGAKTFLATAADAPTNSHVQASGALKTSPETRDVFNLHAGLIRVTRHSPLGLEDYLKILEGKPWKEDPAGTTGLSCQGIYADLKTWSASPKGLPFLLHGVATPGDRMNEILFLKLSALRDILKEVRTYVRDQQLPLLNLSPASFHVRLAEVGDQYPALWAAKCELVKPGQAHPLNIKTTAQKYFIRLGLTEPSPFLPEGLGAHSFGIGSVRLRNVQPETDGMVLEGTLVAEDYLGLDPHDLLWFKLPLAEERMEFYAHVYPQAVGPREARFRTVPAKLADPIVAALQRIGSFARSPYEIWPLLSSPCDMHSIGVIAVRILLARSKGNFRGTIDDILSLARHLGKDPDPEDQLLTRLKSLLEREPKQLELIGPHSLIESDLSPEQARTEIHFEIWLEAVALLLRLFPGTGCHSFCRSFGDVPPLTLETVFDRPIQELDNLILRLRSVLVPSLAANEEIAAVIIEQLANAGDGR